jgi:uncharacterized protein YyaL (SSP411 family)
MNRLGSATSPYLLQHAANPVDWWPWGEEAFAEAKRRDVPLLISVGYSSCHWCHVMAHESFENDAVAQIVNRDFVAIKVDREERPDVDAVYMTATQAMTGQGGWPMTVFAAPDGKPFYCGTYFPRPAFVRLLAAVTDAWRTQREAIEQQGGDVVEAMAGLSGVRPASPMSAGVLDGVAAGLDKDFDEVHGGFGGAPKFPPHLVLQFLLRQYQRTGTERSLELVRHTCEAMARGGLYDQVAGGFARYSVDDRWIVPHFEKMLYDNALLLRVYAQLYRLTGDPLARRVALGTTEFLFSGLATDQGGFASSLDADAAGAEGSTYVWTPAQLRAALGEAGGEFAADLFGVTEAGTFEHGSSVLRLMRDLDGADEPVRGRAAEVIAALRAVRAERVQPARDDKVVAAWNGLAITALVEVVRTFGGSVAGVDQVVRAGELLAGTHLVDGRLRRVSRDGVVGEPVGVLEDYGCVAEAFCALHQLTGEGRWLELAGGLLDTALERFADGHGGFFDTADDAESLVTRPADPTDNATPSGLSAVAAALVSYSALSGRPRYREAAEAALATVVPIAAGHPRFAGYACAVGEALLSGPYEIAVVGTGREELVEVAWRLAPPGAVLVAGVPDQPGVPLLAERPVRDGVATAYVCRGFVCDRPVTSAADLVASLPAKG